MLTELVENGEEKCVKYWPDQLNEWVAYDSVKIHVTEQNPWVYQGLDITHRIIFVLKDGQDVNTPHEVNHFQIHGWSSDGAPENTQTTTELAQMLNEQYLNGNYYFIIVILFLI